MTAADAIRLDLLSQVINPPADPRSPVVVGVDDWDPPGQVGGRLAGRLLALATGRPGHLAGRRPGQRRVLRRRPARLAR